MANYPNFDQLQSKAGYTTESNNRVIYSENAVATLMRNMYVWMAIALVITGFTAFAVANTYSMISALVTSPIIYYGLIFAELGLVYYLSSRIFRMSFATAGLLFAVYSIVNGVTLSLIFLIFKIGSIVSTFFITAGTFGAMAVVGSFLKKDLSFIGRFALMALIGLIIAGVVNIFMRSEGFSFIIAIIGVLVFTALTAYDAQKMKNLIAENGYEINENTQKLALIGALELYLDFVNLFLYLLRLLGSRRD
ncbi:MULTISPECIES: Bax inhibitor-1/YccA family protein [unclassified Bacteroides]|uniref:Bax inhibitor-1/YccA family protein n=1 Tax=unclassified Bacteroides TaxID=2646097 RepID=UPI0009DF8641|nr:MULTISPECIES: Bax inhibitor-1/YccA family protein [unclassified Bacteroides]